MYYNQSLENAKEFQEEMRLNKIEGLSQEEVDDIFKQTSEDEEMMQQDYRQILEEYALLDKTDEQLVEMVHHKYWDDIRKKQLELMRDYNSDILNEYVRDN